MHAQRVAPTAVHVLRQAVLRPHQDVREMTWPGDDDPRAGHFGVAAPDGDGLAGVATVVPEPHPGDPAEGDWRVRGMATDPSIRGTGAGALLLDACVEHARAHGGRRVWCTARVGVAGFYERAGFRPEGEPFEIPHIGPHVLMSRRLADPTHTRSPA